MPDTLDQDNAYYMTGFTDSRQGVASRFLRRDTMPFSSADVNSAKIGVSGAKPLRMLNLFGF